MNLGKPNEAVDVLKEEIQLRGNWYKELSKDMIKYGIPTLEDLAKSHKEERLREEIAEANERIALNY